VVSKGLCFLIRIMAYTATVTTGGMLNLEAEEDGLLKED
jgi:hypothetical protein